MKPATFIVAAVAALSLAAASANAASPSLGIGSPSLSAPLPNESNPGAIGGSPQSLDSIPSGDLGAGPSSTPSEQAYGATTGDAGSSIFSPNAAGSSASGMSNGG